MKNAKNDYLRIIQISFSKASQIEILVLNPDEHSVDFRYVTRHKEPKLVETLHAY